MPIIDPASINRFVTSMSSGDGEGLPLTDDYAHKLSMPQNVLQLRGKFPLDERYEEFKDADENSLFMKHFIFDI